MDNLVKSNIFTESYFKSPTNKVNFLKIIESLPDYSEIDYSEIVKTPNKVNLSTDYQTMFRRSIQSSNKNAQNVSRSVLSVDEISKKYLLEQRISLIKKPVEKKVILKPFKPYNLKHFRKISENLSPKRGGLGSEVGSEKWKLTNVNFNKKLQICEKIKEIVVKKRTKSKGDIEMNGSFVRMKMYAREVVSPKKEKPKPKIRFKEGTVLNLLRKVAKQRQEVKNIKEEMRKVYKIA